VVAPDVSKQEGGKPGGAGAFDAFSKQQGKEGKNKALTTAAAVFEEALSGGRHKI
jgi:hypothetical protein